MLTLILLNVAQNRLMFPESPDVTQYLVFIFAKIREIAFCRLKSQSIAARPWPRVGIGNERVAPYMGMILI